MVEASQRLEENFLAQRAQGTKQGDKEKCRRQPLTLCK